MVTHIVCWRLKGDDSEKQKAAERMKADLEALNGKIPGLISLKVGIDFSKTEQSSDVVLVSQFTDAEALAGYAIHPLHVACVDFVRAVTCERRVVDFE